MGADRNIKPVSPNQPLTDFLIQKAKLSFTPAIIRSFEIPTGSGAATREADPTTLRVLANGHLQIATTLYKPSKVSIAIELDAQGRLLTPSGKPAYSEFRPVIDFRSQPEGEKITIDLRPLFFYPLGDPHWRSDILNSLLQPEFAPPPFVRILREKSPTEYVPTFHSVEPYSPLDLAPCPKEN
jgi:hypothetical protein